MARRQSSNDSRSIGMPMKLSKTEFVYQGKTFKYFDHPHHETWTNERRVEVPIAMEYLMRFKDKRILEVGNVISYYYLPGIIGAQWDVLDKYERVPEHNLINEDVLTFQPKEKYDMIFSISTMEHVGFDHENEYKTEHGDYRKSVEAIKHLQKDCLKKGGSMFLTLPWAYNATLHVAIFSGELDFKIRLMKRMTEDNRWQEVRYLDQLADVRYSYPYYAANGIILAYYEKT